MQKTVKTYNEEGVKYQFDSKKMLMYANQMKSDLQMHGRKLNKSQIMRELAEKLYISEDAVKSWMYGNNGPSDLEQVKLVANYFGVEYHQLLNKEEKEMATNNNTMNLVKGMANEAQVQYTKEKVREIYQALIVCKNTLMDYYYTDNPDENGDPFNPVFKERQERNYNIFLSCRESARSIMEKAMLDIPQELFEKINEYLWTDMSEVANTVMKSFNLTDDADDVDIVNFGPEDEMMIMDTMIRQYGNVGFIADMRRIFGDYIVK